jgi:hypothetical protein
MVNLWTRAVAEARSTTSRADEMDLPTFNEQLVEHWKEPGAWLHDRMRNAGAFNRAARHVLLGQAMRLVGHALCCEGSSTPALHPAVLLALKEARPRSMRTLFFQAPRKSKVPGEPPTKLVYFKDYDGMVRNMSVRTTSGKYLADMFPAMSSERIRDIVALTGAERVFGIAKTMGEMLNVIQNGPHSCMKWSGEGQSSHPYNVYKPELGWALAWGLPTDIEAGEEGFGTYQCRALVHIPTMSFVRTYGTTSDGGSADSDELRMWLINQGYTKQSSWRGLDIARIPSGQGQVLMPYVDGSTHSIYTHEDDSDKLTIGQGDDFVGEASSQCGTMSLSEEPDHECEDCGAGIDDDDVCYVGYDGDYLVCEHCRSNNYTYAYGRRGREYYVPDNEVVHVGDDRYHNEYLDDNGIEFCKVSGEHCHESDMFHCEWREENVSCEVDHTEVGDGEYVCDKYLARYVKANPECEQFLIDNDTLPDVLVIHPTPLTDEEKAAQAVLPDMPSPWPFAPAPEPQQESISA